MSSDFIIHAGLCPVQLLEGDITQIAVDPKVKRGELDTWSEAPRETGPESDFAPEEPRSSLLLVGRGCR
jgi:hypothetical protein